jgi:hypothetical protein
MVQTNGGGNAKFDTKAGLELDNLAGAGNFISATATELCDIGPGCLFGSGPTSEFSRSVEVAP